LAVEGEGPGEEVDPPYHVDQQALPVFHQIDLYILTTRPNQHKMVCLQP
jgi:hypothetical protein